LSKGTANHNDTRSLKEESGEDISSDKLKKRRKKKRKRTSSLTKLEGESKIKPAMEAAAQKANSLGIKSGKKK